MFREEDLARTLSLFEGSDLIFISYGKEEGGQYLPHSEALRIEPDLSLLKDAISHTPLLPNDFGIMPFRWKARSEEEKTRMLLERKLSRWSEGELFAHGYLIIDRVLLDIDLGEIEKESAVKLAEKLREKGIGKVGYTGGGILAVLELDGEVEVRDRESFRRIVEVLRRTLKKTVKEFDEQSLNVGKGLRLVGTHSRKRGVDTEWILWEEGKRFDLCELLFGVKKSILSLAPEELRNRIKERFGIEIKGSGRKTTPEEVFQKAREFYSDLDGRRNDFMLGLSGELLSAGVPKERAEELYYEYLADLEKKDRPHQRVKQTMEWVYREGKTYSLGSDYPPDFLRLVKGLRGEGEPLSWKEFAKEVSPENYITLLKTVGEEVYTDGKEVFHLPSQFFYGTLRCRWKEEVEEEGKKMVASVKGELPVAVYMNLPPCVEKALQEYEEVSGGENWWYLKNLLEVSFLLPPSDFEVSADREIEALEDSPLAMSLVLMAVSKGVSKEEVGVEKVKKSILRKNDDVWNLVRCMNPLLRQRCSSECKYYRFRHYLPEVLSKKVDEKTGEIVEVLIRVNEKEIEVNGKVLESVRKFRSFLERRGVILSRLALEWLYEWIMKYATAEYVDEERERFISGLREILASYPKGYQLRIRDEHVWIPSSDFLEILRFLGYSMWRANIGKVKKEYNLKSRKIKSTRYTLIPLSLLDDETIEAILDYLIWEATKVADMEGIETVEKEELTEEDLKDEDFVLGRKVYVVHSRKGVEVYFMGEKTLFTGVEDLSRWFKKVREEKDIENLLPPEEEFPQEE